MAGYPGTIASTWQRAGRAGRRASGSAAVMVASSAPLDQFIVRHPSYFFEASPEHAANVREELPAPRTVHQVTNVQVVADDGRELTVTSSLVMVEYRKERQRVWGGLVEHRLRRTDGGLRIAAKRVDLVNSESELCGIACLF